MARGKLQQWKETEIFHTYNSDYLLIVTLTKTPAHLREKNMNQNIASTLL